MGRLTRDSYEVGRSFRFRREPACCFSQILCNVGEMRPGDRSAGGAGAILGSVRSAGLPWW